MIIGQKMRAAAAEESKTNGLSNKIFCLLPANGVGLFINYGL